MPCVFCTDGGAPESERRKRKTDLEGFQEGRVYKISLLRNISIVCLACIIHIYSIISITQSAYLLTSEVQVIKSNL